MTRRPGPARAGARRLLAAVLALCLALPAAAQDRPIRVDREEARILTERLLQVGQPRAAREIALGLLAVDPDDVAALVVLTRAELMLGRPDAAERAATLALTAARTPQEEFLAAMNVANVYAQTDRFTRAQVWLRRARNLAPSDEAAASVATSYGRLRQLNPWSVELQFGLTPSNNVNSGNSNETITFAYLPGVFASIPWSVPADDRPLSGLEVNLGGTFKYRLRQSETSQTTLEFGAFARTYVMSQEARATAPEVTGESLSYGQASLGIGHQWVRPGLEDWQFATSLTYARSFDVEGATFHRLTGDLSADWRLTERDQLSFGLSLERAAYFSTRDEARSIGLRTRWTRALENGQSIGLSLSANRSLSDTPDRDYVSASAAISYGFGEVLPQVDLTATLQRDWRSFETVLLDPSGREDHLTMVQLQAGIGAVEFWGFEPVATLRAQRNDSSVPYYDTESVTLGLSFRSSF